MRHADPFAVRALLGPRVALGRRALTGEHGVSLPPFIDHHVHLHLIEHEERAIARNIRHEAMGLGGIDHP